MNTLTAALDRLTAVYRDWSTTDAVPLSELDNAISEVVTAHEIHETRVPVTPAELARLGYVGTISADRLSRLNHTPYGIRRLMLELADPRPDDDTVLEPERCTSHNSAPALCEGVVSTVEALITTATVEAAGWTLDEIEDVVATRCKWAITTQ